VTSPLAPTVTPPAAPTVDLRVSGGGESVELSGAVGIVVLMGVLTLLPAIVLLMTGFTRILIVLGFLRTAIGTQGAPPTQLLVAVALLLTGLVMRPVMAEVNTTALQPYLQGEMGQAEAYRAALVPLRGFMLANTRDQDLRTFAELGGEADATNLEELGTMTVLSAFVTSELRTAFQMGFMLFLPFLVIDLIVASVLMSMGMFMLPPIMVSLPFKLLLFVLADGWSLVMQGLVASFRAAA
jgi:flagellar biosynthetic protein FliP